MHSITKITTTQHTMAASEYRESVIRQRCGCKFTSSLAEIGSAPSSEGLGCGLLSRSQNYKTADAVQHSGCCCDARKPSVAALEFRPGLMSCERKQQPLNTRLLQMHGGVLIDACAYSCQGERFHEKRGLQLL